MSEATLSTEARQFLRAYIQSLEQLEILAVMRDQPDREWTTVAIYDAILSNERSIQARLEQFATVGLVTMSDTRPLTFRYAPKDAGIDQAIENTLHAYRERRVLVIETIFRPDSDPAQSFSAAFRFKLP